MRKPSAFIKVAISGALKATTKLSKFNGVDTDGSQMIIRDSGDHLGSVYCTSLTLDIIYSSTFTKVIGNNLM